MKSIKKIPLVVISILFITLSSTSNTLGITHEFEVKEGDEYYWTVIVGNSAILLSQGSKFRININEIYNGSWIEDSTTYKGTVLNYSIEVYSTFYTYPEWAVAFNGSAIFFNDTTWDLFLGFETDWEIALFGMLFIIPTPINLTWIGDYLNRTSGLLFDNYILDGNNLIMQNSTSNIDFIFSFYNNGTLSEYKVALGDSVGYHIKFGDLSFPSNEISFGKYILVIIPSAIILIVLLNKRKIRKRFE
ncbi:MAG: hypothetical protein ACFE9Z_11320 [Promethearchaeota archaeon]